MLILHLLCLHNSALATTGTAAPLLLHAASMFTGGTGRHLRGYHLVFTHPIKSGVLHTLSLGFRVLVRVLGLSFCMNHITFHSATL